MIKKHTKPSKPYPEFPLFPHDTQRWAKKIRGKLHYFGHWSDPDSALELYLKQKDDLYAGRKPRVTSDGVTLHELVNRFLHAKKEATETGELKPRTWRDYERAGNLILKVLGSNRAADDLDQDDFANLRADMASRMDLVTLGNEIGRCRSVFNYGLKTRLLKHAPNYGLAFNKPSKKVLRINRAKKPKKLFSVTELRKLVYAAEPQLQAMVLLASNCGLGNTDCAELKFQHLDLAGGWLNFGRPKTGVDRRAKLWPETLDAIHKAVKSNEKIRGRVAPELAEHVFLTKYGQHWSGSEKSCAITHACRKALIEAGVYRPGLSFYAIRHTFQTIGERSRDYQAVTAIMGHVDNSMAGVYREEFDDSRLSAVAEYVRDWLFPRPTVGSSLDQNA